jgi:TfoX/Sxy family transcriptional regulator of competence genes
MASLLDALHLTLLDAAEGLGGIGSRKMFGCQALFRDAQIFALVWQTGRLMLRLPDDAAFTELAALSGVEPWRIEMRGKTVTMRHWLLLPEEWNDGGEDLVDWVRRAHAQAAASGKTKAAKRPAARKAEKPKPPAARRAAKPKPRAARKAAPRKGRS